MEKTLCIGASIALPRERKCLMNTLGFTCCLKNGKTNAALSIISQEVY